MSLGCWKGATWLCCRRLGRRSAEDRSLGDEGGRDARVQTNTALGWWSGILAVAFIIAGFFAIDEGGTAGPDAPIGTLVDEIVLSHRRTIVGSVVGMVGALLLIWFASALRARLAREGDAGSLIGFAAYGAGLVMTGGSIAHGSFRLAMSTVHDRDVLSEAIRPLAILGTHVTDALFWGMIGLVVAMSIGAFAARLLPRAMAIVGVALALGSVALTATDHGAPGIALLPWLMVSCLLLLRRERLVVASDSQ